MLNNNYLGGYGDGEVLQFLRDNAASKVANLVPGRSRHRSFSHYI